MKEILVISKVSRSKIVYTDPNLLTINTLQSGSFCRISIEEICNRLNKGASWLLLMHFVKELKSLNVRPIGKDVNTMSSSGWMIHSARITHTATNHSHNRSLNKLLLYLLNLDQSCYHLSYNDYPLYKF